MMDTQMAQETPAKPEALLTIQDLDVTYRTDDALVHALNGLDLTIYKGETLGLVGETGAGKTTTALSVMRLLPKNVGRINRGSILFDGVNLAEAKESAMRGMRGKDIAMIFQDPMTSLNPVLTVGDQIGEMIKLHEAGLSKQEIERKVDDMLQLVGINAERKKDNPFQFSGGMKQRVVIAMALACEPKLLLADEPTTALDVTIQAQVLNMMQDLREHFNTAMLLITHDLGIVAQTCDRVAIMYAGTIIEMGSVEDIFNGEHHHPYTVGLFGSIPDLTKKTRRLNPIDGLMPDPTQLPKGCPFFPRCPKRMDCCENVPPKSVRFGEQMIKCHLFDNAGTPEETNAEEGSLQ